MKRSQSIPVYQLFGETAAFPDVVHCERIRDRAPRHGWSIAPHRHAQMAQALLILTGDGEARLDGRRYTINPHDFIYMPAQSVHGFRFSPAVEGLVLSFPFPVLRPLTSGAAQLADALARPRRGRAGAPLVALFGEVERAFASTGIFRAKMLVALAQALLCALCDEAVSEQGDSPARPALMRRLDALLQSHMAEGWTAGDYAGALGVTTGHLSRLCREANGMGARAYIDDATMTEAARLLAFTRLPVAEIGFRLGYEDPPHFSRRFRALRGETPTAYRDRFLSPAPRG